MRLSLLRLALVLVCGLPLLAPPGWECRAGEPLPPTGGPVPASTHPCHVHGPVQQHTPSSPNLPPRAACCSAPDRAATPSVRSPLADEASALLAPAAVAAPGPDWPRAARSFAFGLPIPMPSLQLLHCVWLC